MKLLEKEGKELLSKYGLEIPEVEGEEYVVKAQVLTTDRKEKGGIKFCGSIEEAKSIAKDMQDSNISGFTVEDTLIERKVDIEKELYVSFIYDTYTRSPVMLFSKEGGSDIEEREVSKFVIDEGREFEFREFLTDVELDHNISDLSRTLKKLYNCFREEDMLLLEVNPLAITKNGLKCLDVVVELDEDASYRHNWNYPQRSAFGREKTKREKKAEKIDEDDHRGVAGKYTELDGNIGMLLAGGGASLTNMDALMNYGGKPANYTEYGGNPPTEKVYRLSKIIMSKPELEGLWHVGGTANNTDIYRTMKGFCKALREIEPDYPIVVRRDGPNADKAFELLGQTQEDLDLDMKLYRNDTDMTKTAETLMEMVKNN